MYFDKFPILGYTFDIDGQPTVRAVKDVSTNVRFRKEILDNITLYDEYDMQEGETPEIVAAKVYGSSEYHWVIMLCNQRYDWQEDFPLPQHVFDEYVRSKYGLENIGEIHHYENEEGLWVMEDYIGAIPIDNYTHEVQLNEAKRRIKLISPALLGQILNQFKNII